MQNPQPILTDPQFAAFASSVSVATEQNLGDDSQIFIGGATNVSLIATTTTTTTT